MTKYFTNLVDPNYGNKYYILKDKYKKKYIYIWDIFQRKYCENMPVLVKILRKYDENIWKKMYFCSVKKD